MDLKKTQKLNINDFMKAAPADPMACRLKSLRLPRDLSLGGNRPSKNIYKPNLNVKRNKQNVNETTQRRHETQRNSKRNERNNYDKNKNRFVQADSVFSGGIGTENKIPSSSSRFPSSRGEGREYVKKETTTVENIGSNSSRVMDEILQFSSDDEADKYQPFIPKEYRKTNTSEEKLDRPTLEDLLGRLLPEKQDGDTDNPSFTVWQMPESLAFKDMQINPNMDCRLNSLPEGKIGTVRVRKSGKMDVVLGGVKYSLNSMDFKTITEQLVSVNPDEKNCCILGNVESKFMLCPSWQSLLC
ncbi:unnamed protein product [Acanthoscelides obtectus]|uniref:DNA-directed RNA polymerase III subunit RPC4 n=1 Tax=Acanthoscelides obtectus TaxID=200917 RepID=A0A9P0L5G8_ACAOB|nr:unnamed protein product [Acanthoscelides obtectus]CAK1669130.1 hypothetical protein AOBTE_LOCUS26818 [Acanthoscelides obtectus]